MPSCDSVYYFDCPGCGQEVFVNNGDENDLTMGDIESIKCCYCGVIFNFPDAPDIDPEVIPDADHGDESFKTEAEAMRGKSDEEVEREKKHVNTCDVVCPHCLESYDPEFQLDEDGCTVDYDDDVTTVTCGKCDKKFTMTYHTVFTTRKTF